MHLRVNGTTIEISLDEQPPNFPDTLQIDICNAVVHLKKNKEDIKPSILVVSCNSSSAVSLQLEELSPDTNYTVLAEVPLCINGADLTCNLTTNSMQFVTDSRMSKCNINYYYG